MRLANIFLLVLAGLFVAVTISPGGHTSELELPNSGCSDVEPVRPLDPVTGHAKMQESGH